MLEVEVWDHLMKNVPENSLSSHFCSHKEWPGCETWGHLFLLTILSSVLFAISGSGSYFQHCSSASIHLWLFCTIILYYLIGIWCTLIYHCCWFPCSILPVLYSNWCAWEYFWVISVRLVPLLFDEILASLVHFWGTKCTG